MTSSEIRERFLSYFERRGHTRVASSPVIPWGDPTLMFTNAGMNQFKNLFLGLEKRDYVRATTCQRCIRAGGKHNDLDEVGRTTRHGTFLEMLGNFSFGDYFKEDAIVFAWEFLTGEMGLNPDHLYASIYSTDEEAFGLWRKTIGLPERQIIRFGDIERGDEENFWSMGPTGPCGPCSELYIDRGKGYGPDDPYESLAKDFPRYLELWNLVFMQFNRDETGELTPLPRPSIDTGMGLERIAMVHQGRENIFETDILGSIIRRMETFTGKHYEEKTGMPFRVAADHVRTLSFAIADGAIPSNEGRGYVLRRILRRASRYLRQLDVHEPLLYRLVDDVVALMGDAYPVLGERTDYISLVIRGEEERFLRTLDQGIDLFERLSENVAARNERVIGGEDAFRLYDTYGFPVDLTRIMAEEKGMTVDMAAFESAMESQRERAREASSFAANLDDGGPWIETGVPSADDSTFVGYEMDAVEASLLRYRLGENGRIELIFDRTPFYALSGGQASDTGTAVPADGSCVLHISDVRDLPGAGRVHIAEVSEGAFPPAALTAGHVRLSIDTGRRNNTRRNHSATHLLQAGLRSVLGDHVRQSGSSVDPERLRFDFNHFSGMSAEEIEQVEEFVTRAVIGDSTVECTEMPIEEARTLGAMSLFDEKYGDIVRVIRMGDISKEFCGGTHVRRTGEIGPFRIVSESSVAAGIRRIEAVTGMRAHELIRREHQTIQDLVRRLNAGQDEFGDRVDALSSRIRDLEKQVRKLKSGGAFGADGFIAGASDVSGVTVAAGRVDDVENTDELKSMADAVREKLGSGVGVLGAVIENKVSVVVVVTDDLIAKHSLRAGDIVKQVAAVVGGSGGGRPHMAMAGGKDVSKLDEALASVPDVVRGLMKG